MNYSEDLDKVVTSALEELISLYKDGKLSVFEKAENQNYYQQYKKIKEEKNSH